MTSRRDFLGILAAAPVVAPVVARFAATAVLNEEVGPAHIIRLTSGEMVWTTPDRRYAGARFSNTLNFRGDPLTWDGPNGMAVPNRLYGAQINADGEAV